MMALWHRLSTTSASSPTTSRPRFGSTSTSSASSRSPTPDFGFPVVWLAAGDCQVHLFERPGEPPSHAHFGLEIAEFMPVYRRMKELGVLDHATFGNAMYELPDGGIQMYVRDPAGNLVELDHPDASTIPQDEVPEYMRLADVRPQEGEAGAATLWHGH